MFKPEDHVNPAVLQDAHPNELSMLKEFDGYVIHEDADILVIDKPAHVNTMGGPVEHSDLTLREIARSWRGPEVGLVHRLDGLTSGVMVMSKTSRAYNGLSEQFADPSNTSMYKQYVALVEGAPQQDRFIEQVLYVGGSKIKAKNGIPIGSLISADPLIKRELEAKPRPKMNGNKRLHKVARTAVTKLVDVRTLEGEVWSALQVQILTGRRHQIRVALSKTGLPIVDDPLYNRRPAQGRLRLHAHALRLRHPRTNQPMWLQSTPPADFYEGVDQQERSYIEHALREV